MYENKFYRSENERLKKLIDESNIYSKEFMLSKVLLDQQSPYLKSVIINKGFNHGIKLGVAVKEKSFNRNWTYCFYNLIVYFHFI